MVTKPSADPLWQVYKCTRDGTVPPLPWVVQWSADAGLDPLHAAWNASKSPGLMKSIAELLGVLTEEERGVIVEIIRGVPIPFMVGYFENDLAYAAGLIRQVVAHGRLPTLAEFLQKFNIEGP